MAIKDKKSFKGPWQRIRNEDTIDRDTEDNKITVKQEQLLLESPCAGLVWLSDDYKSIDRVEGKVNFKASDLVSGFEAAPKYARRYYDRNSDRCNRVRVHVFNGVVEVWIGEFCPKETVEIIKSRFGLNGLMVKVIRDIGYDAVTDEDVIKVS